MVFCDLEGQLARASDMRLFTSGYSPPSTASRYANKLRNCPQRNRHAR